jgi:diguanylate cyclase (GGDEF)-like protein
MPDTTADALAAVRRLSFATLGASDAGDIHRALAAELLTVFGVDQVHVGRLAEDEGTSHQTQFRATGDGGAEAALDYVLRLEALVGTRTVLQTRRALKITDARSSSQLTQELVEQFDVASLLFVPLTYESQIRAVVGLVSETTRDFDDAEIELAYTLANQASAGLSALEMKSMLRGRAEQQAAMARAAGALNARLDLRAVLDTLCRETDLSLGGDLSGVYLGDGRSGGNAVAAHGIPKDSEWWSYKIRPGEGVAGQVLVTGQPAVSNDYQREVELPAADALTGVKSAVSVPVRWNGELKGALSVAFYSMRSITPADIDTLQAIADLAAMACSNAEAFEQAQAAARTDSLTGFLNHGALQVRLREEIWRARRSESSPACLLFDLDNFKPINDRHGHLVGDEILQRMASAVASEFRPYDGIARYGGDEFVLLLPGVTESDARYAAERLRRVVAETGRDFGDLGTRLTASVGIAMWREPLTAGELLDRADRALLLAKQRGKDGVVLASVETERELVALEGTNAGPSALMSRFWDLVSHCEQPSEMLTTLPFFLRRTLALEEAALYEPGPGSPGSLRRQTAARTPGDPAPTAFPSPELGIGDGFLPRLETGAVSRGSWEKLARALDLSERENQRDAPVGSYAAIVLARGGRLHALLFLRSAAREFPLQVLRLAEIVAGQAVTVLLGQTGGSSPGAVAALAAAIDARDNYTLSHSEQVVALACEVARRLGLHSKEIASVRDGAMLHDVGKVAIPNEILYKPSPLTNSEWEVMREHPVIGEGILRRTPELADIAHLVRHEHERWDGTGYPDGLQGTAIPIGSRIVLACDAYNAMITARPYRAPMSHDDAIAELSAGAGSQFDPDVVQALLQVLATHQAAAER